MTEPKPYAHTSTGSKNAIVTFIATFIACVFLFDNTVGLVTGIMFIIAGMLTVSVALAMPFYLYKKKHLDMYSIVSMIEFLLTITLTVTVFLYFFSNQPDVTTTASSSDNASPYTVICDQPIPWFTLAKGMIQSKVQADAMCSCIWKTLSPSDKNLSAVLAKDERHGASEDQLRLFNSRIGVATESCKTEGL